MRLGTCHLLVVYHNRVLEDKKTTGAVSSPLVINWGCFVESSSRVANDPAPPATLPDLPRIVVFGRQAEKAEPCSSGSSGSLTRSQLTSCYPAPLHSGANSPPPIFSAITRPPSQTKPTKTQTTKIPREEKKGGKGGSICISSLRYYFERFHLTLLSLVEIHTPPNTSTTPTSPDQISHLKPPLHRLCREIEACIDPCQHLGIRVPRQEFVLRNALVSRSAHTPPRLGATTTPIILAHPRSPRLMTPEPADEHHTAWWHSGATSLAAGRVTHRLGQR